jgi:CheY-like chemotaxis protein
MVPINILLVEDNEGDIVLTTEALQEGKIIFNITVIKDGWEAIQFLNKRGKYANQPLPDLVLLDLNLPKMNGVEVLKNIRSSSTLNHIPVMILSISTFEKDIQLCMQHLANCFITKPLMPDSFLKNILLMNEFGLYIVKLPPTTNNQNITTIN